MKNIKSIGNKKIVGIVLVALFFVVAVFLVRQPLAVHALKRADYNFNGGAYDTKIAGRWYKIASFLGDKSAYINYQLARIYFVENKLDEARKEIDIFIKKDPENKRAFYVRGLIDGFDKKYEEAINDFEKFTAWAPQEWAGWNDLAWVSYEGNNYAKAKDAAIKGLEVDAENPWLINNLGLAYLGLGEKDQAQDTFAKIKDKVATLTLEDWKKAYPGNDINTVKKELAKFKTNFEYNMRLASVRSESLLAANKGFSVSACGSSTLPSYSCLGTDPDNATLCSSDDTGLTGATNKTVVVSCGEPKCEYTCNIGFELNDSTQKCDCIPVYDSYFCSEIQPSCDGITDGRTVTGSVNCVGSYSNCDNEIKTKGVTPFSSYCNEHCIAPTKICPKKIEIKPGSWKEIAP